MIMLLLLSPPPSLAIMSCTSATLGSAFGRFLSAWQYSAAAPFLRAAAMRDESHLLKLKNVADFMDEANTRADDATMTPEDEDEFATVHHAKPKFKPLPRQACQQDSRLVARVCDLARRGLTLAQIDADLREEGV